MVRKSMISDEVTCSFCGKPQSQVAKIVAGPDAYICNECVHLCFDILEGELGGPGDSPSPPEPEDSRSG